MKFSQFFQDPQRRKFIYASAASLAAVGLGTFIYARMIEPRRYSIDRLRVDTGLRSEELQAGLCPQRLRILHLSDLHMRKPESDKLDFLRRATDDFFDLIFITGDIFEDHSALAYAGRIVTRPPRLGTFAVLGNHDCYDYNLLNRSIGRLIKKWRFPKRTRDVSAFVQALESAGINVLCNAAAAFPEEKIRITGIDYPGIRENDLNLLCAQAEPDSLNIVLMHVPHKLSRLSQLGFHAAFCGHTHGGQVRIPFFGPLITDSELPRHEASGPLWRGETFVHVSRGIGADPRTNIRFFCPPHATIIEVCHWRA